MGLFPATEVPPVHILNDIQYNRRENVIAGKLATFTIEELIALQGGERIPTFGEAAAEFNVAFILAGNRAFRSRSPDFCGKERALSDTKHAAMACRSGTGRLSIIVPYFLTVLMA